MYKCISINLKLVLCHSVRGTLKHIHKLIAKCNSWLHNIMIVEDLSSSICELSSPWTLLIIWSIRVKKSRCPHPTRQLLRQYAGCGIYTPLCICSLLCTLTEQHGIHILLCDRVFLWYRSSTTLLAHCLGQASVMQGEWQEEAAFVVPVFPTHILLGRHLEGWLEHFSKWQLEDGLFWRFLWKQWLLVEGGRVGVPS